MPPVQEVPVSNPETEILMSVPPVSNELEEQFFPTTAALVQRWMPWLKMFRGFRMAIGVRRLLLALVAVICWMGLEKGLGPSARPQTDRETLLWKGFSANDSLTATGNDLGVSSLEPSATSRFPVVDTIAQQPLLWPITRMISAAMAVVLGETLSVKLASLGVLLGSILISILFGGAISRMAAVDFALQSDLSIRQSLGFSCSRLTTMAGAPLIGCVGVAGCWAMNFCIGLFSNLPVIGPAMTGIFWIVPLIIGILMTIVLIGILFGWPLMIAGICVDAGDAFDGFSRACSYVFNRPLYGLVLTLLMVLYGTLLLWFVECFVRVSTDLTLASVSSGIFGPWPWNPATDAPEGGFARDAVQFWMNGMALIPAAFVFSYFWTMVTIIYFLLRKREDATPLHEVWIPSAEKGGGAPVVGIPGAESREQQAASETNQPEST